VEVQLREGIPALLLHFQHPPPHHALSYNPQLARSKHEQERQQTDGLGEAGFSLGWALFPFLGRGPSDAYSGRWMSSILEHI
jgi:hypothetical protein